MKKDKLNIDQLTHSSKAYLLLIALLIAFSQQLTAQDILTKTYYDDAKSLLKEQFYVNDSIQNQLTGSYTSFYLSGVTQSTGYFKNNLASGAWKYYNETGRIKQSGFFENGKSNGKWLNYYENGNIKSEGYLENNIKSGEWIYYFENQNIKTVGYYYNDLKQSVWNYFYEDEKLKAQAYYDNDIGIYKEFYTSGDLKMEGQNKYGKSDSLWVYYFETGEILAEGYFENGLKTGTWKYYYKDNTIASEGGYDKGETIGNWIYYHENGNKSSEGIQTKGLKDGYWKLYYNEGTLKGLGQFDMGTGDYKEYYNSGNLKLEGQFKDGLNDGKWIYYDENGALEGKATFKEGVGDYVGYYNDQSKKMEGKLEGGKRIGEWKLYKTSGELAGTYHPLYEEEAPVFLSSETIENPNKKINYDKPEFRLKSQKSRYFSPKVGEYRGFIFSTNPLMSLANRLPFSLEYFIQERLGFELTYQYLKNPFYKNHRDFDLNKLYSKGHTVSFTNKFYSEDGRYGMLYFGQQVGFESLAYSVNINKNEPPLIDNSSSKLSSQEKRLYYALIVGSRWIRNPSKSGITFDVYAGLGVGRRYYRANYTDNSYDALFSSINKSKAYFPIIIGLSVGFSQ